MDRAVLLCEWPILHGIDRSISTSDLSVILAHSASSLAEIEGLLTLPSRHLNYDAELPVWVISGPFAQV